jgi:hypothetical protein
VEIVCRDGTVAVHPRSYEKADFIYNPLHYLALLEHKTKALDQAAPLDDWQLGDCVHRLRGCLKIVGRGGLLQCQSNWSHSRLNGGAIGTAAHAEAKLV